HESDLAAKPAPKAFARRLLVRHTSLHSTGADRWGRHSCLPIARRTRLSAPPFLLLAHRQSFGNRAGLRIIAIDEPLDVFHRALAMAEREHRRFRAFA